MTEPNVGVVRGATQRLLGIYDQVKQMSPLLQVGFEKAEALPWKKADVVIDGLDSRITQITQIVTGHVTAVQTKYQEGKAAVNDQYEKAQTKYQEGKAAVTGKYEEGKTLVCKTGEKWKDLRGALTKKTGLRIEEGLGQIREFSATRGKEIIHIDLIEYSREVLDGASDAVSRKLKPVYEPLSRNLAESVQKVNQAANQLRQALVLPDREQLKLKLKNARQAARELSSNGIAYAQGKYGDLSARIAETRLRRALEFIESSPELFKKIKDQADLNVSKGLLANIHDLVLAIRDVVMEASEEQPEETEAEETGANQFLGEEEQREEEEEEEIAEGKKEEEGKKEDEGKRASEEEECEDD